MYSLIVFTVARLLALYDALHHLDVNGLDGFMLWYGYGRTARLPKGEMTAAAAGALHFITVAFHDFTHLFEAKVIG